MPRRNDFPNDGGLRWPTIDTHFARLRGGRVMTRSAGSRHVRPAACRPCRFNDFVRPPRRPRRNARAGRADETPGKTEIQRSNGTEFIDDVGRRPPSPRSVRGWLRNGRYDVRTPGRRRAGRRTGPRAEMNARRKGDRKIERMTTPDTRERRTERGQYDHGRREVGRVERFDRVHGRIQWRRTPRSSRAYLRISAVSRALIFLSVTLT